MNVGRLVQCINEIMIHAVNTDLIDANPVSGISMAFETHKINYANTATRSVAKLMRSLIISNLFVTTRCLIEWQSVTLAPPSEAAGARWAKKDLESKHWTIPAERMKAKRENIVLLSPQVLDIL